MKIIRPDDMHVHLRDGDMLRHMAPHTARNFARALVMPNTTKPILTREDAETYQSQILAEVGCYSDFQPLMTIKLIASTTPEQIRAASPFVIAGKLYPEGVTTNSDDGVSNLLAMYPVFEAMEKCGMVLSLHGEVPGAFSMDRELLFLFGLQRLARDFPKLRIVLEHITTADAVSEVTCLPDTVAATITVHHLFLTLDDIVGNKLDPHSFCKPIAKRPADKVALMKAALSGNPKFFLGTDSAPHHVSSKHCAEGCAGIFTAPVAMPILADFFTVNKVKPEAALEAFTSHFGADFYGLPRNEGYVELTQSSWVVPDQYEPGVVPFRAGKTLGWKVIA